MERLIAIDPGVHTGVAVFDAGSPGPLVWAGVQDTDAALATIVTRACSNCIIEVPQVYRGHLQKGDPNDLIDLAVVVGRYYDRAVRSGATVRLVKPREWKGQLPKDVCWRRVQNTLSFDECGTYRVKGALAHNMHDAIGLGTWYQGRWH